MPGDDRAGREHLVHCVRCDEVVAAIALDDGELSCPTCGRSVLAGVDDGNEQRLVVRDGRIEASDGGVDPAPPRPRRLHGGIIGNALVGLHNALYGPKDEPPAVIVEDDQKHDRGTIERHLDDESPKCSWARVRRDNDGS